MKACNHMYLVFDDEGKVFNDNIITGSRKNIEGAYNSDFKFVPSETQSTPDTQVEVEIQMALDIKYDDLPIHCYGVDSKAGLYLPGVTILTQHNSPTHGSYAFHSIKLFGKQYLAMVYESSIESLAFHLVKELVFWYLPKKEPMCCCKVGFNKVTLPYINKVFQTACDIFPEVGQYYKDSVITKDICISTSSVSTNNDSEIEVEK